MRLAIFRALHMWQDNGALIGRRASGSREAEGEKIAAVVSEQEKAGV